MSSVVPEGWQISSVEDLLTPNCLFSDGDWVESKDQDPAGTNRLLQLADIGDGRFVNKSNRFMNDEQFNRLNCTQLQEGDVLIARMPEPIGRACILPRLNNRLATVVDIAILRPSAVDSYWLMSVINSAGFRTKIEEQSSGTTRTRIGRTALSKIKLLSPPLPEQKKIASILTSVDEVIEDTQKQIDKLQDLKKATMNELLTKGIGHTEFKDGELGQIPKSWEVVRFQEVFESYTYGPRFSSKDYSPIGNVKTIRGTDLTKDWCISYKQVPLAELDEKVVLQHRLKENDVVMITTADCGFSAVFKEQSIPFIASAYAIRLRPTLRINSSFCVYYLQTSIAKTQIEKYERKGTVSNLPGSDVMNVKLPLPSLDEQSGIVSALTSIDTNISNNLEKLHQTQSLKKSLMQDLLTGKVRVTVN